MTARLSYEPLRRDHAVELYPVLATPAVHEFIGNRPPASIDAMADQFARMAGGPPPGRGDERWCNYVVRRRDTAEAIGQVQATVFADRAEVAYLFGPDQWGHGYATEAMRWLHQQLRERTAVPTFWATVLPTNARSVRLLDRLGYAAAVEWPPLASYDPDDAVYRRNAAARV